MHCHFFVRAPNFRCALKWAQPKRLHEIFRTRVDKPRRRRNFNSKSTVLRAKNLEPYPQQQKIIKSPTTGRNSAVNSIFVVHKLPTHCAQKLRASPSSQVQPLKKTGIEGKQPQTKQVIFGGQVLKYGLLDVSPSLYSFHPPSDFSHPCVTPSTSKFALVRKFHNHVLYF